jgi:hypothetical protein
VLFAARGGTRRRCRGLELWIDLLTRDCAQYPGHDDAIIRLEPALDHAQIAHPRADRDLALLDRVVLIEHEQVSSALIGTQRVIGYQLLVDNEVLVDRRGVALSNDCAGLR